MSGPRDLRVARQALRFLELGGLEDRHVLTLSEADKALFDAGVAWIGAMQEACRALIGLQDATFADDGHWPAVPAGVAALASRF